jgi:hypothetical protein
MSSVVALRAIIFFKFRAEGASANDKRQLIND